MPVGIPFQIFLYSIYFLYSRQVYSEVPPILTQYVLPDFILMILMLVPFYLRFRPSERGTWYYPRGIRARKKFAIDSRIKSNFCFRADIRNIELPSKFDENHHESMRNTPVCKRVKNFYRDFTFNSKQPLFTKDFLRQQIIGQVCCLSYMTAESKQNWSFFGRNQI